MAEQETINVSSLDAGFTVVFIDEFLFNCRKLWNLAGRTIENGPQIDQSQRA